VQGPPSADASAYTVSEVDIRSIIDGSRPEQNILILPYDLITVRKAPIVYAVGLVNKQGGFVLNEKERISVLQLIAMAGGTQSLANTKDARIVRPVPGATRIEVPVNLKDIMAGKSKDMMLEPEDILYVPGSYAKSLIGKTIDSMISVTTGLAIYR
jgi:polysaccharide export outer membrane protein